MPLLSALNEFKDSFVNIANEESDLGSKNLPLNTLQLPTTEAAPFVPEERVSLPRGSSEDSEDEGYSSDTEGYAGASNLNGAGDFDFSAFLNDIPEDVHGHDMPEHAETDLPDDDFMDFIKNQSVEEPPPEEPAQALDVPEDMPAGIPDGLLDGFSDEIDAASKENDFDPFNDEIFNNMDMPNEELGGGIGTSSNGGDIAGNDNADDGRIGDDIDPFSLQFDLGGEIQDNAKDADIAESASGNAFAGEEDPEAFDLGDEIMDMGGEVVETRETEKTTEEALPDFDFADTGFDFPENSPFPEGDATEGFSEEAEAPGGEESGMDSLQDFNFTETNTFPDFGTDSFENAEGETSGFDSNTGETMEFPDIGGIEIESQQDQTAEWPDFDTESTSGAGNTTAGETDFALPELDDLLDKPKTDTKIKSFSKRKLFRRAKKEKEEETASDEVEEIQLSQGDLNHLLKTLSNYPLNLRIVCEELIAEQVLAPQHLSKLIRFLVNGAPAKETVILVKEISGKSIVIPKSFEKSTGEAFKAEQSSFAYIFVHNFLPILRLVAFIAVMAASIAYLGYKFIYVPIKAESLYKHGYERIGAGEYRRANELFAKAYDAHKKKKWFYKYAEGFRDERRYMLAEEKYDELLKDYPRDKKGVLDYASLETNYLMNYDKANRLLQRELLDFNTNDFEGLLAAGDNFFLWADSDPSRYAEKYENARFAYARLLEKYGWKAPIVERMMKYFIRTDNLKEVLPLKNWFSNNNKLQLSPAALAELGGYFLDKQLSLSEETRKVPDPYIESIEGVRTILLQAVRGDVNLPEPHYHLARYYKNLGNAYEERLTLENAIRAFDIAQEESVRRRTIRVDAHSRYANWLIDNREFFKAEEQVVRGIELYEDFLSRNLLSPSPQLGQLYAAKGDLEFFVKTGNMEAALKEYRIAEKYGYAPPEIQYRMGAAFYQLEDWKNALEYLFKASADLPLNRKLLFALGNTTFKRGDYYAAQGYYNRLLDILEIQRSRLPILLPNDRPEFMEVGERLMMVRNNAGAVYEALAKSTGNSDYRSRALVLYAESARAWDAITRNPKTMERMSLAGIPGAPGVNLGFLNANNALRPSSGYNPEIFIRIDKDVLEPSRWEELAPLGGLLE